MNLTPSELELLVELFDTSGASSLRILRTSDRKEAILHWVAVNGKSQSVRVNLSSARANAGLERAKLKRQLREVAAELAEWENG